MKNKILASTIASVMLALGVAGSASAAQLNDSFDITLDVGATCSIFIPAGDVNMIHDGTNGNTSGWGYSNFGLICNEDLPFDIEVDAAGGATVLTDTATSKTVGATLKLTDQSAYSPVSWGPKAEGMQYGSTGTGLVQQFEISAYYNNGKQPATGLYLATHNLIVNY